MRSGRSWGAAVVDQGVPGGAVARGGMLARTLIKHFHVVSGSETMARPGGEIMSGARLVLPHHEETIGDGVFPRVSPLAQRFAQGKARRSVHMFGYAA